jgi:hypothetical protein
MQDYQFELELTAESCLDYYRGTLRTVMVRCENGLVLQFPASLLQQFITADGIRGTFVLTCDERHKCVELRHLSSKEAP